MAPSFAHLADDKTVCVMDASGSLGSSLVEKLLHLGYNVHATIFNHGNFRCDKNIDGRLRVFQADPFDYQSIVDALKGCSGLFYTFEPSPGEEENYDEFMVEMEVRAAHNVLEACAQADMMERVVFTSSVTAVIWKQDRKLSEDEFDEKDWSDLNFCRKYKLWHALAKTMSEKTAWALAMDRGIDMVTINAGLVLTGEKISVMTPYLYGTQEMYEDGVLVTVDLQFLVDAHICVYEHPSAFGRYLCFDHAISTPQDAMDFSRIISGPRPPPSDDMRVMEQRIKNMKLNKVLREFADDHIYEQ